MVACGSSASFQWTQPETSGVDILFVVDASGSMVEEQQILASGFTSFIHEMGSADFRIGVVSSDIDSDNPDRGKLVGDPPYLTPIDDFIPLFETRVLVGTEGSDHEKGLAAALLTVTEGAPDFARSDASLLVVIVSDEDDCSDDGKLDDRSGSACYTEYEQLTPVIDIVEALQATKSSAEMVQVAAIVGPKDPCDTAAEGTRYNLAAWQTAGITGDVCEADWSHVLIDLGLSAASDRASFAVGEPLVEKHIVVLVDGTEVAWGEDDGWTWDAETCLLHFNGDAVPDRGSAISAEGSVDKKARPCPLAR